MRPRSDIESARQRWPFKTRLTWEMDRPSTAPISFIVMVSCILVKRAQRSARRDSISALRAARASSLSRLRSSSRCGASSSVVHQRGHPRPLFTSSKMAARETQPQSQVTSAHGWGPRLPRSAVTTRVPNLRPISTVYFNQLRPLNFPDAGKDGAKSPVRVSEFLARHAVVGNGGRHLLVQAL